MEAKSSMSSAPSPLPGALALVGTVVPLVTFMASASTGATAGQVIQYVTVSALCGLVCAAIGAVLRESRAARNFTALGLGALGALGVLLCLAHPRDFVEPWVGLSILIPAAGAAAMVITLSFVFATHRRLLGWRPGSMLYDLDRRRIELVAASTIAVAT